MNVAVAVEAIQAIGNLAGGLRNHFSGNSRLLLPVLLVSISLKAAVISHSCASCDGQHNSVTLLLYNLVSVFLLHLVSLVGGVIISHKN